MFKNRLKAIKDKKCVITSMLYYVGYLFMNLQSMTIAVKQQKNDRTSGISGESQQTRKIQKKRKEKKKHNKQYVNRQTHKSYEKRRRSE